MIKVVEIISDTNIGGAGILLLNRLSCYNRKSFKEYVILPKDSKLKKRFDAIKIPVFEIDGCFDRSFDLLAIFQISMILKKIKPKIINAHGCLSARISAYLSKIPIKIYTRHCSYPASKIYKLPFIRFSYKALNSLLSDTIIAVADAAKQDLVERGVKPSSIAVIINGARPLAEISEQAKTELRRELKIPQHAYVVTICARLEECKDHFTFLRAAAILSENYDDYRFLILGDGSLRTALEEFAKGLKISDKVIFTGFVDNTSPYMNITHVNVNCSIGTETSSLAISEGMSLAIPSVASDYGGNPYMIQNGTNGYIFKQKNASDLARKIAFLRERELYSSLSKNARARFESELNAKAMTEKTENLYLSLTKNIRRHQGS